MELHTAGWSGLWTLAIVFFVVVPSIRWGVGAAGWGIRHGRRWGRHRGRDWAAEWALDDEDRPSRQRLETLREELDTRQADIDALHGRVAELENRLDFAERLLAERHEHTLVVKDPSAS